MKKDELVVHKYIHDKNSVIFIILLSWIIYNWNIFSYFLLVACW